jgi:1,4-alpha-glucan branching enzyme
MLEKMPGDEWQRFANLRLIYTYMFSHPGKKLLFMGSEFGQGTEWDSSNLLDWYVLDFPSHHGVQRLVRDLNDIYRNEPALHSRDFEGEGFEWIDCHDSQNSVLVYLRSSKDDFIVTALNFTPVPREGYRIGVPQAGVYREMLNSDAADYNGSGIGNGARSLESEERPWMGRPFSVEITLPPLAGILLKLAPSPAAAAETPLPEEDSAPAGGSGGTA